MSLTKTEKELAILLDDIRMDLDDIMGVTLFLKTEEKKRQLVHWMQQNPKAEEQEVLEIVLKIFRNQM